MSRREIDQDYDAARRCPKCSQMMIPCTDAPVQQGRTPKTWYRKAIHADIDSVCDWQWLSNYYPKI